MLSLPLDNRLPPVSCPCLMLAAVLGGDLHATLAIIALTSSYALASYSR